MKKIIVLLSFTFVVTICMGQDLSSVVKNMPDDLILKLDANQKDKLFETVSDTARVMIVNQLGGEVERVAISDDYLSLRTSDVGLLQIKLLPLINNSYIIGVIKTVCAGACDSSIGFYTTSWEPLSQVDLFPEKDKDWFLKTDVDRNSDIFINASAALDMTPIKYLFSPDNTDVQAVYEIKGYLSTPDYELIKPFVEQEDIIFKWNKTAYTNK